MSNEYYGDNKSRDANDADLNVLKEYLDKITNANKIGISSF